MGKCKHPQAEINGILYDIMENPDRTGKTDICAPCAFYECCDPFPGIDHKDFICNLRAGCYYKKAKGQNSK